MRPHLAASSQVCSCPEASGCPIVPAELHLLWCHHQPPVAVVSASFNMPQARRKTSRVVPPALQSETKAAAAAEAQHEQKAAAAWREHGANGTACRPGRLLFRLRTIELSLSPLRCSVFWQPSSDRLPARRRQAAHMASADRLVAGCPGIAVMAHVHYRRRAHVLSIRELDSSPNHLRFLEYTAGCADSAADHGVAEISGNCATTQAVRRISLPVLQRV